MLWILLLCHFIADYPLQSAGVVRAKAHLPGLGFHIAIHFLTLLVVMVGVLEMDLGAVWPAISALAGSHFAIDAWKNVLTRLRPGWVIFIYLQDQALHIVSILLIVGWLGPNPSLAEIGADWIIPALALVLVTHTWFISERILYYRDSEYLQALNNLAWQRMVGRATLLAAWLIGWNGAGLATLAVGLCHHWLDLAGPFRQRALITDAGVVLALVAGLEALA